MTPRLPHRYHARGSPPFLPTWTQTGDDTHHRVATSLPHNSAAPPPLPCKGVSTLPSNIDIPFQKLKRRQEESHAPSGDDIPVSLLRFPHSYQTNPSWTLNADEPSLGIQYKRTPPVHSTQTNPAQDIQYKRAQSGHSLQTRPGCTFNTS